MFCVNDFCRLLSDFYRCRYFIAYTFGHMLFSNIVIHSFFSVDEFMFKS